MAYKKNCLQYILIELHSFKEIEIYICTTGVYFKKIIVQFRVYAIHYLLIEYTTKFGYGKY